MKKGGTGRKIYVKPIPDDCTYVVKKGDSIYGIAKEYGLNYTEVMQLNGLTADSAKLIQPGQKIVLKNSESKLTDTGHGSGKSGGGDSQPPSPPEPPKGPPILPLDPNRTKEDLERAGEVLTEVVTEAKDKVVEVIPEIVSEAKETVTNVVSESGKIIKGVSEVTKNSGLVSPYGLEKTHKLTLGEKELLTLTNDIKLNGIKESIKYVIHNGKKYIVDGHHRAYVAKILKLENVFAEEVNLPYAGYKTIEDLLWVE